MPSWWGYKSSYWDFRDFSCCLKYNILIMTLLTPEHQGGQNLKWELEQKRFSQWCPMWMIREGVNSWYLSRKAELLTNTSPSSVFKDVWALLGVWAEIQNNFPIFPNSSPLPNYSSQTNVLLPSESRQSRKEIIRHFHLEHCILIPFFLLLTDLSILLLTCFKYDQFYLSRYYSSSIKLHKNCQKQADWKGTIVVRKKKITFMFIELIKPMQHFF